MKNFNIMRAPENLIFRWEGSRKTYIWGEIALKEGRLE